MAYAVLMLVIGATNMNRSLMCFFLPALFAATGCSAPADDDRGASDVDSEDALVVGGGGTSYTMRCTSAGANAKLTVTSHDNLFDVVATVGTNEVVHVNDQRPALNVRVEDGDSSIPREYIDFNDHGLELVPVDSPKALELDLVANGDGYYAKKLTYKNGTETVTLDCRVSNAKLIQLLGIAPVSIDDLDLSGVSSVGFDIDDTLAFSTPTFVRANATGGTPKPDDVIFWTATNGCDQGCPEQTITLPDGSSKLLPSNVASTAKSAAVALVAKHKALGHRVYAITARPDINGDPLRDYIEQNLGIARADVFFEPDLDQPGNPKGKTDRMVALDLDMFYGDSDSDITDSAKAFADASGNQTKQVRAVRFMRSPKSSNRKAGKLNKYHPGYYGEPIVAGSYE